MQTNIAIIGLSCHSIHYIWVNGLMFECIRDFEPEPEPEVPYVTLSKNTAYLLVSNSFSDTIEVESNDDWEVSWLDAFNGLYNIQ